MAHTTRTRIFQAIAALGLLISTVAAQANSLEAVNVSHGAENSQVVKITLSEALAAMPLYFATTNPHRIVLDFANVDNAMGRRSETVDAGIVHGYNVVHAADRTRVVVDLNGPATYSLRKDKNILLIALHGARVAPGAAQPAHFASADVGTTFNIRDVAFRRGKNGEGRIEVNLSDPGVGIDIKQKGAAIQLDFLNTTLPQALQRRLDVSEFATPAQTVETFAQGKATRMIVKPKGKWDYVAYQTGRNFILEVTSLEGVTGQAADKKKYDGEKLSLDFQNVDVRSVLKVIADFTGKNIVAADSVTGNVTIRLKDVPWDQALDVVLRAKGLDKRMNGNVIWVEQSDALTKKEEEEKRARQSSEELEPLLTRNYKLNYVRADDAMTIISGGSRSANNVDNAPTCSPSSEAHQIVPFPMEEVTLDFQILGPSPRSQNDNEVLVVITRKDRVEERVAVAESAGLKTVIVDVDTYAALRAFGQVSFQLPNEGKGQTVAIVDLGHATTHVNILHDNQPVYQREHPFGGQILTQEISRRFGLPWEEAEDAKCKGLLPDNFEVEVLRPFLDSAAQEVARALQLFFASSPQQHVDHLVLAGGCSLVPGLDEAVYNKTQIATIIANPFAKMSVSSFVRPKQLAVDAPSLFVACGLALRRFDLE